MSVQKEAIGAISPNEFWRALSSRATGAAVVTTLDDGAPAGFFALSVTHLSADPPILIFSVGASTSALAGLRKSGIVAVNYLDRQQEEIAVLFSGKMGISGAARFAPGLWERLATGAPVLKNALGAVDCRVDEIIERHGAFIVLARILAYRNRDDGAPLIHFRGGYSL